MKKLILLFSIVLITADVHAQLIENFDDGNFTSSPTWSGDTSQFVINQGKLQLMSSGSDSSYLVTPLNLTNFTNVEWRLNIQLTFSPSSANYARYYLISNYADLEDSLSGYYLQFGESGSNDAIALYRQSGWQNTLIARGPNGQIAGSFDLSLKITCDSLSNWEVLFLQNNQFIPIASGNYPFQIKKGNTGIKCVYTSSNATKFYIDNIYAGPAITDTSAPVPLYINTLNDSTVVLFVDEPLTDSTASDINNYLLLENYTHPATTVYDSVALSITCFFNFQFQSGNTYHLYIKKLIDLKGNALQNDTLEFIYKTIISPDPYDIIINEIMANPSLSPGLPQAEYIELYNRTDKYITLAGCTFSDASTKISLQPDTIDPGSFLVICNNSYASLFNLTNVSGQSGFPSLNNEGDNLSLRSSSGNLIDRVEYTTDFYHDDLRKSGGWSIERKDPSFTCSAVDNWSASKDPSGGTPGKLNSVFSTFTDTLHPYPVYAVCISDDTVEVHMNKAVYKENFTDTSLFFIDGGIGHPHWVIADAYRPDILILKTDKLSVGIIYTLTVNNNFSDCAGNQIIGLNNLRFGLTESPDNNKIAINEILYNPLPGGSDFIELYNAGNKIVDLSALKLAGVDPGSGQISNTHTITSEKRPFIPGDYILLSENPDVLKKHYVIKDFRNFITCDLPSLPDNEGIVMLTNNNFEVIDSIYYSDTYQFPLLSTTEGVSLERISPYAKADLFNLHSAGEACGFATPGYQNSQYFIQQADESTLHIEPFIFSPDNDGNNDILTISYKKNQPGNGYITVLIYNAAGTLNREICHNLFVGSNETLTWNGINDKGSVAESGIYIIYLRYIGDQGILKEYKKAIVLAKKI